MASTNHTTNYSLSQFVGSDKPAWLGDYNQDMDKIDTQMKTNATAISTLGTTVSGQTTAISGLTSDVSTAQSDISGLGTRMTAVETKNTEQDTAISTNASDIDSLKTRTSTLESGFSNQANAISSLQTDNTTNIANIATNTVNIASLDSELDNFESRFNLTTINNITSISGYSGIINDSVNLTLAQNSDGSVYKLYGTAGSYGLQTTTTASLTAVAGLAGYYGIKTTLKLASAPDEAYLVASAGIMRRATTTPAVLSLNDVNFAVDNEGYIYICVGTQSTLQYQSGSSYKNIYFPCVYFNKSFGDEPTPEE